MPVTKHPSSSSPSSSLPPSPKAKQVPVAATEHTPTARLEVHASDPQTPPSLTPDSAPQSPHSAPAASPETPASCASPPSSSLKAQSRSHVLFLKRRPLRIPNRSSHTAEVFHLWGRYLRSNAVFLGEQQSGNGRYKITVRFKTVNLLDSLVTGYLQINGLTENHPKITTFFKGEIINNPLVTLQRLARISFAEFQDFEHHLYVTKNQQWGSSFENDLDHWYKLSGFSRSNLILRLEKIQNGKADTNYIYMRWKEEFLVPDSRIKQIHGASFEGFYYILLCIGSLHATSLPRLTPVMEPGTISGLYYHKALEKFQSLSLRSVPDNGSSGVFQFC